MTRADFLANAAFPRALLVWCIALACAPSGPAASPSARDMAEALSAMERKVCVTSGVRTNTPSDRCASQVDRATYIEPLRDVFLAAPSVLKAYLCSIDRIYFDYHSAWNASFVVRPDSQSGKEYRSIAVRRGVLENRIRYTDWATAWTQHWWTGGPIDHPTSDPAFPRVETDSRLTGPSGILFQLLAHEVGHALAYDYGVFRRPDSRPFEPAEFGYLSWISPQWEDSSHAVHVAVARELAIEAVRRIDFTGSVMSRVAAMEAAEKEGRRFDAGAVPAQGWTPAPRESIETFLDRLDRSSFTTVFSTWHPEDDWTESFMMMMLPSIARRFDIVSAGGRRVKVLAKASDSGSPFGPKRRFIEHTIDRALADFRARQRASPNVCLAAALAGWRDASLWGDGEVDQHPIHEARRDFLAVLPVRAIEDREPPLFRFRGGRRSAEQLLDLLEQQPFPERRWPGP